VRILVILFLLFFSSSISHSTQYKTLSLIMFKVFHGDMMFMRLPNGQNMIIDAGKNGKPKKFMFPYFRKHNIKKIDFLVLTHPDSDHIGGATEVIENYPVGEIWHNRARDSKPYRSYVAAARKHKVPMIIMARDVTIHLGETSFTFYHPAPIHGVYQTERNNNSLVFKLEWRHFSMFFSGDVEISAMKKLHALYGDKLQSRVYKVAHHGDKSFLPFLKDINPEVSVCPCVWAPIPFMYFPNWRTKRDLRRMGKYYTVRRDGNVLLTTDGYDITVRRKVKHK